MQYQSFIKTIVDCSKELKSPDNIEQKTLELFYWQANHVPVYALWLQHLNINPLNIKTITEIPHLPVEFFKNHRITSKPALEQATLTFKSSGTTLENKSIHLLFEPDIYHHAILSGFESVYGKPKQYCFLALLPSYIEQGNSSLIYMVEYLMHKSQHSANNFYLYDFEKLANSLIQLEQEQQKTILIGVSYALLDFAAQFPIPLKHTTIMETGGMKGRKREMIKKELHHLLKDAFKVGHIHSEYGMTELLSQSYSTENNLFKCSPTQQIIIKDLYDPFAVRPNEQSGRINIIDFANIDSCAFIQTADLGKKYDDGSFEVLGRIDHSDIRGCNLMI